VTVPVVAEVILTIVRHRTGDDAGCWAAAVNVPHIISNKTVSRLVRLCVFDAICCIIAVSAKLLKLQFSAK
jgi:hypothetical protein